MAICCFTMMVGKAAVKKNYRILYIFRYFYMKICRSNLFIYTLTAEDKLMNIRFIFLGLATYELATALVSLGSEADLAEAIQLLEECALILDYDPKDTHHGKLADIARKELDRLKMK